MSRRPARFRARFFPLLVLIASVFAGEKIWADWTHFRGPLHTGVSAEKLARSPSAAGPKLLWEAKVGIGTSSITVSGERVLTMGNDAGEDTVWCFEAATGKVLWKFSYPLAMDPRMFEGGTAATPTIDGNRVYTVSHQGDLFCLDLVTGQKIWYRHYQRELGGRRPQWGYAGSPTVEGNLLLCDVGGKDSSTVALDKMTGRTIWQNGSDMGGYASPVVAPISGTKTVVVFKAAALVGLDLKDGHELWRADWKTSYAVNAATPLVFGDRVFVSSGYGTGCALFQISGATATEVWHNKNLRSHISSAVAAGGFVYGIDGQADPSAPLVCLDLATGETKWQEKNFGGSLVLVDGDLFVLTEKGEIVIGKANPSEFQEISRTQVLPKRCWAQPTVANGRIFCRNNLGQFAALEIQ